MTWSWCYQIDGDGRIHSSFGSCLIYAFGIVYIMLLLVQPNGTYDTAISNNPTFLYESGLENKMVNGCAIVCVCLWKNTNPSTVSSQKMRFDGNMLLIVTLSHVCHYLPKHNSLKIIFGRSVARATLSRHLWRIDFDSRMTQFSCVCASTDSLCTFKAEYFDLIWLALTYGSFSFFFFFFSLWIFPRASDKKITFSIRKLNFTFEREGFATLISLKEFTSDSDYINFVQYFRHEIIAHNHKNAIVDHRANFIKPNHTLLI